MADLWSLGTLGIESIRDSASGSEFFAYFAAPLTGPVRSLIDREMTSPEGALVEIVEIAGVDWLQAYRDQAKSFAVAKRWWVDPREPDQLPEEPPPSRVLLRIPARTAFGTGSHASTSLAIESMERLALEGARVLDVGTGSGILAIVALASGAREVVALDIDPVAVIVAGETCRLNGCRPQLLAGELAALELRTEAERFDCVVANVLPIHLRPSYPGLAECLRPTGSLVLSGILDEQASGVSAEMSVFGLQVKDRLVSGEWAALTLERA